MAKSRKRKPRKPRDMVTLGMILACKAGFMRDRRERRRGARNEHRELLAQAQDEA